MSANKLTVTGQISCLGLEASCNITTKQQVCASMNFPGSPQRLVCSRQTSFLLGIPDA